MAKCAICGKNMGFLAISGTNCDTCRLAEKATAERHQAEARGKAECERVKIRREYKMKTFLIYNHPTKGYAVIKEGFSWPAFFFWWIWALIKKMWGLAIVLLIFSIPVGLSYALHPVLWIILTVIVSSLIGSKANTGYKNSIEKRGYKFMKSIMALSNDAALAIYVNNKESEQSIQQESKEPTEDNQKKKCPYCAETIKKEAIFCRFCHQQLT